MGTPAAATRILLIDDDPLVGMSIERMLVSLGSVVVRCSDEREALGVLAMRPAFFSIVISDVNMPFLSGIELARIIHHSHPLIRIVLMSGEMLTAADLQSLPFLYAFLSKPLRLNQLATVIEQRPTEEGNVGVMTS